MYQVKCNSDPESKSPQSYNSQDEAVSEPGCVGPDAVVPSAGQQQAEPIFGSLMILLAAGCRKLHHGYVLSSFHRPLWCLMVEGGVISIPGGDAANQDTLNCAPVEIWDYPGVHAEPPQTTE